MMWIYNSVAWVLVPLAFIKLWWRGRHDTAYRQRWSERVARDLPAFTRPVIWFHAVSVGETIAAQPFVEALLTQYGTTHQVLLTNSTVNGSRCTEKLFGQRVQHCYLPYDAYGLTRRFLNHVKPCVVMLMETEVWPNMAHLLQARHIPLILVNARLSAKSARGYQRLAWLFTPVFASFAHIAAQALADAQRFIDTGAQRSHVSVAGNLKFNLHVSDDILQKAQVWREYLPTQKVFLAASTHEGEEVIVLDAFIQARLTQPELRLWLAPRHPERREQVTQMVEKYGLTVVRRSQLTPAQLPALTPDTIVLIDTIGELVSFYALADVCLVGGSLGKRGGHNILEPAAVGTPILTGPSMYNFATIFAQFSEAQALRVVTDKDTLAAQLQDVLSQPAVATELADRARQCFMAEQQALPAHMAIVAPYLQ